MAEPAAPNNANNGNTKSFGASIEAVFRPTLIVVLLSVFLVASQSILTTAYTIRLHAIENFGYSELYIIICDHIIRTELECTQPLSRLVYNSSTHTPKQSSMNLIPTSTSEPHNISTTTDGKPL